MYSAHNTSHLSFTPRATEARGVWTKGGVPPSLPTLFLAPFSGKGVSSLGILSMACTKETATPLPRPLPIPLSHIPFSGSPCGVCCCCCFVVCMFVLFCQAPLPPASPRLSLSPTPPFPPSPLPTLSQVVLKLAEHHADLNTADNDGWTVLMRAAVRRRAEVHVRGCAG